MPEDFANWLPKNDILTADEILEVIRVAVSFGVNEVRLTGGEPLIRHDIVEIVSAIANLPNSPAISITTNGIRLAQLAQPLKSAGLSRVNISLDTLSKERFIQLTKRDELDAVLEGIRVATAVGLNPIKINSVLMPGINDDEAPALLHWALANNLELRFIEQMPLDAGGTWNRSEMIDATQILKELSNEFELIELPHESAAPAQDFQIAQTDRTVGVIASVSKPFCANCDRIRLTADGQLRNCLFAQEETDLREVLRTISDADERRAQIAALLGFSVATKKAGHGIGEPGFAAPARPMSAIGG